jgi:hypothetical protein
MATTKKTTKSKAKASSKAKSKSSSIGNTIKTAGKAALIPGYGALSVAKGIDDYIQKKDPSLSKSKTYNAVKQPAKKVKGAMDYVSDKAIGFAKGAADVISNPGKYIEKGAAKVGKAAYKGMKAVDDYIERADPNLSKSKLYGAIKGEAKKVPKNIENKVGFAGKVAAMGNPLTGSLVAGREVGKVAKKGAKAADDYVQKNDPYLSKSKLYGAVKGGVKSALGVKSGSTSKKATPAKASAAKPAAKNTPAKPTPAKPAPAPAKPTPSVSELWKQKTGTSWSEAKKLGLSDGSAKSNVALMKKLQSGSVNKNTVKTASPGSAASMKSFNKEVAQNVEDELSGKIKFDEPVATMRRGGMVRRKMQAGGMTNKIPTAKGARLNPTGRKTAMTALGIKRPNTMMNRMQYGGRTISEKAAARKVAKGKGTISKSYPSGPEEKGSYIGYSKEAKKSDSPFKSMKDSKPARPIMKTGGMVNSNSKVSAIKSAGSKGVKTGANTRITASKVARGRVGGTSTAPRTASPKAKMGMSVRKRR